MRRIKIQTKAKDIFNQIEIENCLSIEVCTYIPLFEAD
jgi:hypothetical protein